MKWMEAEYPADVDILVCECRWQIIPREIDIEAEERFDELDEIYRKDHPRPTEFNAIRKWEKERLMTLEHQVMEEIVYKRREWKISPVCHRDTKIYKKDIHFIDIGSKIW